MPFFYFIVISGIGNALFSRRLDSTLYDTWSFVNNSLLYLLGIITVFTAVVTGLEEILEDFNLKKKWRLRNPPGTFILKSAHLLSKKHYHKFEQEISDLRLEYFEALSEKNNRRARGLVICYYCGLLWSMVIWIASRIKEIIKVAPK